MRMNHHQEMLLFPEQPYIHTSLLKQLAVLPLSCLELQYPTICVVTGAPGIGKRVAARFYQEEIEHMLPSFHTMILYVPPNATPRVLATLILEQLHGTIHTGRSSKSTHELIGEINCDDLRLVVFDSAERLNNASFEFVRSLFTTLGCSLWLVGLPSLLQTSQKHPSLVHRTAYSLNCVPLTLEEIVHVVLPAFVLPLWEFDPSQEEDRLLAEQLWAHTTPSLRRLHSVLETASCIARFHQRPKVTAYCVQEALRLSPPRG